MLKRRLMEQVQILTNMPIEKTHQERKVKNFVLLGVFLLLVVMIFAVTLVKLKIHY